MSGDDINASIVRAFDAAAATYDAASQVQREIAHELVLRAAANFAGRPRKILDLGCGAGHVAENALRHWPRAQIIALDAAPAMLAALKGKFPGVTTVCADASDLEDTGGYELILSSMMLHWLPNPRESLEKWRELLAPGGMMFVALPVAGSLAEWRDACRASGVADGLWSFPDPDFSAGLSQEVETKAFVATYPDARRFLQSLKQTGARKSPPGHRPASSAGLRRLLAARRKPFYATFRIALLTIKARSATGPTDDP